MVLVTEKPGTGGPAAGSRAGQGGRGGELWLEPLTPSGLAGALTAWPTCGQGPFVPTAVAFVDYTVTQGNHEASGCVVGVTRA